MAAKDTHDINRDLTKEFDLTTGNTGNKNMGISSTQGIDLSGPTPPGYATVTNVIPGLATATPGTAQSLIGTSAQACVGSASAPGFFNVAVTEQMMAMLNYAAMRQLMGATLPPALPTLLREEMHALHKKIVTEDAQDKGDKGNEGLIASKPVTEKGRENTEQGSGRNKRRFITNSVQLEDVGDSTSGTTPRRSLRNQRENTKLKEKVSSLKSQLRSLETELKENRQETELNEISDHEKHSPVTRRESLRRKSQYISDYEDRSPERRTEGPRSKHQRRPTLTTSSKEKRDHGTVRHVIPRISTSPFSDEILLEQLPINYRPISLDYDGTTDPEVHMARFEGLAALHQYGEGIKCRIFATTLSGMAQRWFYNLKADSIHSYGDLYLSFMRQFASSKQVGRTAISLMDIKQEPQETLREYVARFNVTALDIPEAESQIKCYAFVRGLKQGPLFDALQITPPKEFDHIMAILPGYLQLEDAKAARRAEAEKHKGKKNEGGGDNNDRQAQRAPYKGLPPRIPSMAVETDTERNDRREQDKGQEGNDRHLLTKPADEIFHLIKDEGWFRAPQSYVRGQPKPGRNNLLCEYHNAFGHSTEQCGHLKHQLEILVRKGYLDRFIAKPPRETPHEHHNGNNGRRPEERRQGYGRRDDGAGNRRRNEHEEEEVPQRPPIRGEVHMITGENGAPTSNRAKKQLVRAVQTGHFTTLFWQLTAQSKNPL